MPKEHKKRGRRDEKKRKPQETKPDAAPKRQKTGHRPHSEGEHGSRADELSFNEDFTPPEQSAQDHGVAEFFGLLDDEEQAYFKRADQMLDLNHFAAPDERIMFLESVWSEARGKELKLANSQSCSRLLERLIHSSNTAQLKALFRNFSSHFLFLVQHRFASHCCEALFVRCAPVVTEELLAGSKSSGEQESQEPSMESLFLHTLGELQENLGFLMTERFASHAVRVLLVVLSGRPLSDSSTQAILKSRNKEALGANSSSICETKDFQTRSVPSAFDEALDRTVAGMIGTLDQNYLRTLATHPLGNPVLQLLLQIEFGKSGKQKAKDETSLFRKLMPEMPPDDGSVSAQFIRGLLYDPTGSHLLETIITCCPGKAFKSIYLGQFHDNVRSIAKNDNASYVLIKIVERLNGEDLQDFFERLRPDVHDLIAQSRTSVIRTLIERYHVRQISDDKIAAELASWFGEADPTALQIAVELPNEDAGGEIQDAQTRPAASGAGNSHASLFVQKMLEYPGSLRKLAKEWILQAPPDILVAVALDKSGTYVIQKALSSEEQVQSFRRVLLRRFTGKATELALDAVGPYVLDAFWQATSDLRFLREPIARELAANEALLRDSPSGRIVWRKWMLDLFTKKKQLWVVKSKESEHNDEVVISRTSAKGSLRPEKQTGIEKARQDFAAQQRASGRKGWTGQREAK